MSKLFLYKLGTIGTLAIVALWSFYALPDKNEKRVEQKALIGEEFASPTVEPEIFASPALVPTNSAKPTLTKTATPAPASSLLPTLSPTSIPSPVGGPIPTVTPFPTATFQTITPEPTPSPTGGFTPTPIPTNESTPTPLPTSEPTPTPACLIKGNINSSGDKIYHVPGCASYNRTEINEEDGEKWFCSEEEAVAAGWRKAQNCPQ